MASQTTHYLILPGWQGSPDEHWQSHWQRSETGWHRDEVMPLLQKHWPGIDPAPGARVGRGVIVNHGAVVDHDVVLGAFCHVAPNATLGGGVHIGRRVLVGAGAVVLPGITIADDVVIGAGAVASAPLLEAGTYAGVPARKIQ